MKLITFFNYTIIKSVNLILDPIEQFELFFMNDFLFDSNVIILLINTLIIFFLFYNMTSKNIFGYIMQKLLFLYKKLFNTFFTKKQHQIYFFPFFYIFIFILVNNISGLFPYTYTITALFILTFFLAFIVMFGITWISIEQSKWKFTGRFALNGVPISILLLLIILEIVSYIVRLFSLSLRLFANMLSGHLLIKILISFFWFGVLYSQMNGLFLLTILFWILIIGIFLLEVVIAFLQAYVFVFLCLIYLKEVVFVEN